MSGRPGICAANDGGIAARPRSALADATTARVRRPPAEGSHGTAGVRLQVIEVAHWRLGPKRPRCTLVVVVSAVLRRWLCSSLATSDRMGLTMAPASAWSMACSTGSKGPYGLTPTWSGHGRRWRARRWPGPSLDPVADRGERDVEPVGERAPDASRQEQGEQDGRSTEADEVPDTAVAELSCRTKRMSAPRTGPSKVPSPPTRTMKIIIAVHWTEKIVFGWMNRVLARMAAPAAPQPALSGRKSGACWTGRERRAMRRPPHRPGWPGSPRRTETQQHEQATSPPAAAASAHQ